MNRYQLEARLYDTNIGGMSDTHLWDFGTFTCIGDSSNPYSLVDSYNVFQVVANGLDIEWREAVEAIGSESCVFIEHDYSVFVKIGRNREVDSLDYMVVEGTPCEIKGIIPDINEEKRFVQFEQTEATRGRKFIVEIGEVEYQLQSSDEWFPLKHIQN